MRIFTSTTVSPNRFTPASMVWSVICLICWNDMALKISLSIWGRRTAACACWIQSSTRFLETIVRPNAVLMPFPHREIEQDY